MDWIIITFWQAHTKVGWLDFYRNSWGLDFSTLKYAKLVTYQYLLNPFFDLKLS